MSLLRGGSSPLARLRCDPLYHYCPARSTDMSVGNPMVKAEAVHKSFGALDVLKGIDLEVARGEVMCILGPSGSGKSTFLRCLNHLEQINAG